jgi:glycosyltransferase involved in cell wall biosynthesis
MRVIIYDPMLRVKEGHHFPVCTMLSREAKKRSHWSIIYGSEQFPVEIFNPQVMRECKSGFYISCQDKPAQIGPALIAHENRTIYTDMHRLLMPPNLREDDTVVMHTVMNEHLLGIFDWFHLCPIPIKLRLLLRFPPWVRRQSLKDYDEAIARYAFRLWRASKRDVRFFTDNAPLTRLYESLSDISFTTTPIAIDFFDTVPSPPQAKQGRTWVFAGDGRREKGLVLLPKAWRIHHARFPEDKLRVQLVADNRDLIDEVMRLGNEVTIIPQSLSGAQYLQHVASGDFVLVPYERESYLYRTSHILLEALGMARPVITLKDTWMSEQLEQCAAPAGVLMQDWTPEALANAMAEAHQNADALLNSAAAEAKRIRAQNNATAFFDSFVC